MAQLSAPMSAPMTKRILIVEDDLAIAELQRDYLEIEGFHVTLIHSGLEALKCIENDLDKEYHLIVLDVMLPGVNGYDLLKRIRETNLIPVLMVSARTEDIDKIRGLGLGANDYITKPFSPSELVARIKGQMAMFERLTQSSQPKRELNFSNLTIQHTARRVLVDGKEVSLTATEYDLLYFLASHPDQVFSKETLLDRVWGSDYFGDGATVTVHVGKLREKLSYPGHMETNYFIDTVWGAGYRFNGALK